MTRADRIEAAAREVVNWYGCAESKMAGLIDELRAALAEEETEPVVPLPLVGQLVEAAARIRECEEHGCPGCQYCAPTLAREALASARLDGQTQYLCEGHEPLPKLVTEEGRDPVWRCARCGAWCPEPRT